MPSKRFWAKNNPELDYDETVTKTKKILSDFKFNKIVHISSISSRCQLHTVYGKNKKKSEEIIEKTNDYLIVRLGSMYGEGLIKGVLIDMINNRKVYLDGKSKYSFTDIEWNSKWIIENLNLKNKLVEVGSTDFVELKKLANTIKSTSEFEGEIDNQIILNKSLKKETTMQVLNFLEKKRNEIQSN